nr:biliverdin-producing heme oxygenase [Planctomycetota bacterium]
MAPLPSPSLLPLSQRLRRHTTDSHAAIERTTIARAMVAGTITRAQYGGLLVQL